MKTLHKCVPLLVFLVNSRCSVVDNQEESSRCVWRLEDNFWELVFSFYPVGPRDQTQVCRLGNRCFNPLSHLTSQLHPFLFFFCVVIALLWKKHVCCEGFLLIPLRMLVSIFGCYLYPRHPSYNKYKYLQMLPAVTGGQNYTL